MLRTTFDQRRTMETLAAPELTAHQLARLNALLKAILPQNRFYAQKLAAAVTPEALADPQGPICSLEQFCALPFTFKEELLPVDPSQHTAGNLTFPIDHYVRLHRTSGTHGRPLTVLDTAADWQWWLECWEYILDAAGITAADRVFMAFSFGPFVGFWSAFDAVVQRGCLVVPGGGLNTLGRLDLLRTSEATALFCTPSYALHLAEVGAHHQIDTRELGVRRLVLAGEPGGSMPEIRARVQEAWQAEVLDHAGATEVGPWGYGDTDGIGLHVTESQFIAEFLSVEHGGPASEGELAELVLTPLGRVGSPVIRYRTGDLVRPSWQYHGTNRFVYLNGGVISRTDDMLVIRGVNVFPSSIEQIVRSFPEVVEYRLTVRKAKEMDQLLVEIEDRLDEPHRVAAELLLRLGLKVHVNCVPLGSLPRFEGKGRRLVDERE